MPFKILENNINQKKKSGKRCHLKNKKLQTFTQIGKNIYFDRFWNYIIYIGM